MNWALTAILCVILIEISVRLPLPIVIARIGMIGHKAMRTLGAKSVSDHWKEKVLLAYAVSLFLSTMKLAGYLAAIGAVAVILIFLFDHFGATVGDFLTDWPGILFSLVFATLYFVTRKFHA